MIREVGPGSETAATLRRLKILVVLLLISNIALGIFGFWGLRELDRKYSTLIGQTVPELNRLQTLTALTAEAMRSSNPALYKGNADERAGAAERAHAALGRESDLRQKALRGNAFAQSGARQMNMEKLGGDFTSISQQVVSLLASGSEEQATQQREQMLRPVFEQYMDATTKAADMLEAQGLRASGSLTERTGLFSTLLIGIAGWPLMLLLAFLMITTVLIVAILVRVRLTPVEE